MINNENKMSRLKSLFSVLVPKIHRKIDFIWESFYTLLSPINRVALVIE